MGESIQKKGFCRCNQVRIPEEITQLSGALGPVIRGLRILIRSKDLVSLQETEEVASRRLTQTREITLSNMAREPGAPGTG